MVLSSAINYDEMVHNTVDLMVARIIHLQTAHYYTIVTSFTQCSIGVTISFKSFAIILGHCTSILNTL